MYSSQNQLDAATERLIDVLLEEQLDGIAPPDLSAAISQWGLESQVQLNSVRHSAEASRRRRRSRVGILWIAVSIMGLALGWGMWSSLGFNETFSTINPSTDEHVASIGVTQGPDTVIRPPPVRVAADESSLVEDGRPTKVPRERLQVAELPVGPSPLPDEPQHSDAIRAVNHNDPLSDSEIVSRIDKQFVALWQEAELSITSPVKSDVLKQRFAALTKVERVEDLSDDPLSMVRASAEELAQLWLVQLLPAENRSVLKDPTLMESLREVFAGQTSWLAYLETSMASANGSNTHEDASLLKNSNAARDVVSLVGRVLLNEDLLCARCHDHPLDGKVTQRDYWGLAAIFQRQTEPMFYQTSDGRSRAASPAIPSRIQRVSQKHIEPKDVVTAAEESGNLAAATINLLWKMVFHRTLVGSVADPEAPLSDAHLDSVRELLSEQLVAHNYDLSRALSWIVRSRPFSVQHTVEQHELAVTSHEYEAAERHLRLFFQFPVSHESAAPAVLMELAARWISPDGADSLAQAMPKSPSKHERNDPGSQMSRRDRILRVSFPVKRAVPLAAWLRSIEDFDEQARHVFYVAGIPNPSSRQLDWATQMHASNGGTSDSTLHQLWWLLRHQGVF